MKKNFLDIRELCIIGLVTAIICVIAPLSIPLSLNIPITLQSFIITLSAIILGAKHGTTAALTYILLGACGLPVFSNFTGGWQMLLGPTGGFIMSFPIMAYLIGLGTNLRTKYKYPLLFGIIIGILTNYVCGTAMFCFVTKSSVLVGFMTCVLPFIPFEIIKVILAYLIGIQIKRRLPIYM